MKRLFSFILGAVCMPVLVWAGLESATYIDELNSSNPTTTDSRRQGDDHLRLIKAVLLASFPNISDEVAASDYELDNIRAIHQTLAPHINLVSNRPSITTVDVDADLIQLLETDGTRYLATSVDETVDITASGASGLDTGSEASSTWYFVWIIYNGTTVNGLLSTSATSPTMPSGYTYKGLVGAVYNNGSSNLETFHQRDAVVALTQKSVLSGGTATTLTSVDLSAVVPSNAKLVYGEASVDDSGTNSSFIQISSTQSLHGHSEILNPGGNSGAVGGYFRVLIPTAQTIYYKVGPSPDSGDITVTGYEY